MVLHISPIAISLVWFHWIIAVFLIFVLVKLSYCFICFGSFESLGIYVFLVLLVIYPSFRLSFVGKRWSSFQLYYSSEFVAIWSIFMLIFWVIVVKFLIYQFKHLLMSDSFSDSWRSDILYNSFRAWVLLGK